MRSRLYYSVFLRLVIENYLLLCILTFIVFFKVAYFRNWKEILNTSLAIVILLVILVIPVILFRFIKKNRQKLSNEAFAEKYDSLYENSKETG